MDSLANIRWFVAQIGAREHYAVPIGLHRSELLETFFTDIWCRRPRPILRFGSARMRALASRYSSALPPDKVVSFTSRMLWRSACWQFRLCAGFSTNVFDYHVAIGSWFAHNIANHLRKRVLVPERHAFFGYSTGCLETLKYLNSQGIFCLVDQIDPGPFEARLVEEERLRWPGWERSTFVSRLNHDARRAAEWSAATAVLVNSKWSRDALVQQGVAANKIITVPLAFEPNRICSAPKMGTDRRLTVLWLGSVILRKGIQYLIEAAKILQHSPVDFVVAGPIGISPDAVRSAPSNMKFLARVPRDKSNQLYEQADLFVLPTLSDGFAITQLEAMAHGVPVIATPNCGEVVTHGVDGFIVPVRDPDALASAVTEILADRSQLRGMREAALAKSKLFTLKRYVQDLSAAVLRVRDATGTLDERRSRCGIC